MPDFVPFLSKENKKKFKAVLRAVEKGLNHESNEYVGRFDAEDMACSQILRFDYIVRKVTKICELDSKASVENNEEDKIDKVWFFALDSMLKIKNELLSMLNNLKD